MVNVEKVDTSTEILGMKLDAPILIAPTGGKNLVMPNAESVMARAAVKSNTLICTATGVEKLLDESQPVKWWSNTIGLPDKSSAASYARRVEDLGAKAIVVTVDNQYLSNRDRNNRNRFDYGYMRSGAPKPGEVIKPVNPATAAMWQPHTPSMTWESVDWLRGACGIPVLLKGILTAEDAGLAVEAGADGIVVSNHGGRQLDTSPASLDVLPEVAEAVGGRIPILVDGGVRRGTDVVKALALGASAVMIGRPAAWGLAAAGEDGVVDVLRILREEVENAMTLCGCSTVADITRQHVAAAPVG